MSAFDRFDEARPTEPLSTARAFVRGGEGEAVAWGQQRLTDLGFDVGHIDGTFGERTEAGVAAIAEGAEPQGRDAMQAILMATVAPEASSGWRWPLPGAPSAPITSPFCWRQGRHHDGIDISASRGAAVGASRAGTVIHAGVAGGYGNLVVVGHGQVGNLGRVHSYYAHLLRVRVRDRQSIGALHRLGDVDNTGNSFGDHLHFEIRIKCSAGQAFTGTAVNPCKFLTRC
ncbi:MAG: peptidoglycan DD-metalloendopeptidase family protein [Gemmatimonadetes bacterium]|nr:peptidoglycan DD-metalloendopeptidase family protein [Gemmatimonadota bacterium]